MAAAGQAQFPGHAFRRTGEIDAHHGFARYSWELVAADGNVTIGGMDVAELDASRLRRVVGFFGASSMERLPTEIAMTENMRRFKSIPVE